MADKDYYSILGVDKKADDATIKKAYRDLAKKYHPDMNRNKSDAEKKRIENQFKEINSAYSVLSDADKRANYDRFGTADPNQGFGGGANYQGGGFGGFGGFSDIFSDIFGFGGKRSTNAPIDGDDITVQINLSFKDSVFGVDKEIRIKRREPCKTCGGSGAQSDADVEVCPRCKGTGSVQAVQNSLFGQTVVTKPCPECKGKGKVVKRKCKDCKGDGVVTRERVIQVKVPAGIDNGQVMTYYNEGHCGRNGGVNGNLSISFYVSADDFFKRKGTDLYIDVPVSLADAILGSTIEVPTTGKPIKYALPEGTQSGTKFRLKGYGIKFVKKEQFGDLYVTVNVEMPVKLSKAQREALSRFNDSMEAAQYPSIKKYRDKKLSKN